jgi:gamma-glutamyl phosphate reductase
LQDTYIVLPRKATFKVISIGTWDWYEEYLRLCIGEQVGANVDEAIAHINRRSTKHSDSIVTNNEVNARKFLQQVDSAAVYRNASTRVTDGGEFGFGAEMGISTQKLHCHEPFALAQLTSSRYQIIGAGQVRWRGREPDSAGHRRLSQQGLSHTSSRTTFSFTHSTFLCPIASITSAAT